MTDTNWSLERLNESKEGHVGDWKEFEAACIKQFQNVAEYSTIRAALATGVKKPLLEESVQQWAGSVKSSISTYKACAPDKAAPDLGDVLEDQLTRGAQFDGEVSTLYMEWSRQGPVPVDAKLDALLKVEEALRTVSRAQTKSKQDSSRDKSKVAAVSTTDGGKSSGWEVEEKRRDDRRFYSDRQGERPRGDRDRDNRGRDNRGFSGSSERWKNVKCFKCGDTGHIQALCPKANVHSLSVSGSEGDPSVWKPQYLCKDARVVGADVSECIWDAGAEVNWLSKQAIVKAGRWHGDVEHSLRPTTMRTYHVEGMTKSQPLGIFDTFLVWGEATLNVSFIVIDDPSCKALVGIPVTEDHVEHFHKRERTMEVEGGKMVSFEPASRDNRWNVAEVKIGAAVKWVVDEYSIARVGEVTTIFVKPAYDARDVVKHEGMLFDSAKLKVSHKSKLRVGAVRAEPGSGGFAVDVSAETGFPLELAEDTVIFTSSFEPNEVKKAQELTLSDKVAPRDP